MLVQLFVVFHFSPDVQLQLHIMCVRQHFHIVRIVPFFVVIMQINNYQFTFPVAAGIRD